VETWFYSDPHFDHHNIISYCNRPFYDTEQMNNYLLCEYNIRVQHTDTVYFLGDMSFGKGANPPKYWLSQLNGQVTYIKGNHDEGIEADGYQWLEISGKKVLLIHDPNEAMLVPDYNGEWIIHGHTHHYTPPYQDRKINVSCDIVGLRPVTLAYIKGFLYIHQND
jgi:calcineurin-like phosphoesterase family protein